MQPLSVCHAVFPNPALVGHLCPSQKFISIVTLCFSERKAHHNFYGEESESTKTGLGNEADDGLQHGGWSRLLIPREYISNMDVSH